MQRLRPILAAALCGGALLLLPGPCSARPYVNLETGAAFNGRNVVRIPPDGGTQFSLSDDLDARAAGFVRVRAGVRFGRRHEVSVLVAPLRFRATGVSDREIRFAGETFPAGAALEGRYRFDSYRVSYLYRVWRARRTHLDLGATAKIRDAAIRMEGAGRSAEKANTGFVPLLAFRFGWQATARWAIVCMGDALAAPGGQGRAEDLFAGFVFQPDAHWAGAIGYRLLEGGADVAEVYNFALVHYASLAVEYVF